MGLSNHISFNRSGGFGGLNNQPKVSRSKSKHGTRGSASGMDCNILDRYTIESARPPIQIMNTEETLFKDASLVRDVLRGDGDTVSTVRAVIRPLTRFEPAVSWQPFLSSMNRASSLDALQENARNLLVTANLNPERILPFGREFDSKRLEDAVLVLKAVYSEFCNQVVVPKDLPLGKNPKMLMAICMLYCQTQFASKSSETNSLKPSFSFFDSIPTAMPYVSESDSLSNKLGVLISEDRIPSWGIQFLESVKEGRDSASFSSAKLATFQLGVMLFEVATGHSLDRDYFDCLPDVIAKTHPIYDLGSDISLYLDRPQTQAEVCENLGLTSVSYTMFRSLVLSCVDSDPTHVPDIQDLLKHPLFTPKNA